MEILKLERNDPDFYRLLGPVFGSREIEKKSHDRFYDDPGKVWYLIPGAGVASVLGGTIKNFWADSAQAGDMLLMGLMQEYESLRGIVPLCYSCIFEARGFAIRKYRVHFMEVDL